MLRAFGQKRSASSGKRKPAPALRNRIDKSWDALQNALRQAPGISSATRYQVDVDQADVQRFVDHKPFIVAPGIYFLGENDEIIKVLQGDVTEDQLVLALQGA